MENNSTLEKQVPHDNEAERSVLASILEQPDIARNACLTLFRDCFYHSAHQSIFDAMKRMSVDNIPIDRVTLADKLKNNNSLESIGGEEYLTDLLNAATLPDIKPYTNILVEKASLRAIINNAHAMQEMAYSQVPIPFIKTIIDSTSRNITADHNSFESKVYIPTSTNCPTQTEPLIELSNVKILSRGNIALLTASAGAGKSSVLEAACAGSLTPMNDNLGLSLAAGTILYVDTERCRYDTHTSWHKALRRAGYEAGATVPECLHWENIRSIESLSDRLQYLWSRIDINNPPDLVLIDGAGDFVSDVNEPKECPAFVSKLLAIADTRNIGILITLHNNPANNSEKARGVLGSELWRKSESVLIINKNQDGSRTLTTNYSLGKNRSANDKVESNFIWDNEKGYHVSCAAPVKAEGKTIVERDKILKIMETKEAWSYTELYKVIAERTGKALPTAKKKIAELVDMDKITKTDAGLYYVIEKRPVKTPDFYND